MNRLQSLSRQVVALAREKGQTLGTAESLTGGMIASAIAGVPGASAVLMGGIVSYDPRVKHQLLGVTQEVIDGAGVVSAPCATQMALGARRCLQVDIAVSATGMAGPGGGTADTPIGTVFLAVASPWGERVQECHFRGGRQRVRKAAAKAALIMALEEFKASRDIGPR